MRSQNRWTGIIVVGVFMGVLFSAAAVLAGSLEPNVGPTASGSQMYTLDQIYNRVNNGAAVPKMSTFTEPGSGPTAGTMHTLDEIYDLAGLRAPVPRTGQTVTYGIRDDGVLQKGVAWPVPRFTDNSNGTVNDNLTGLIWLKNADCHIFFVGDPTGGNQRPWANALTAADRLASGSCGLNDGSTAGQWRLPNLHEIQSLLHYGFYGPAMSNTQGSGKWTWGDPFIGVQQALYWSSTTYVQNTGAAWFVHLNGSVGEAGKTSTYFVWPVRGGQ
jgi:hypothetical protein